MHKLWISNYDTTILDKFAYILSYSPKKIITNESIVLFVLLCFPSESTIKLVNLWESG